MLRELAVGSDQSVQSMRGSLTFKSMKRQWISLVIAGPLVLAGCSNTDKSASTSVMPRESATSSASASPIESFDPVSLPALMQTEITGTDLVVGDAISCHHGLAAK